MEFYKVSRFYETYPLEMYNEGIATISGIVCSRFNTIIGKSMIQPYLMRVMQNSSSRFHHVFEYVELLAVLIQ